MSRDGIALEAGRLRHRSQCKGRTNLGPPLTFMHTYMCGGRYRCAIPAPTLIILQVDLVHHFINATCITLLLVQLCCVTAH
jgi:hypothetical protein